MRPPSLVRCAGLALCLLAGCIQRAPTPESRRAQFDRSAVAELLLAQAPVPRSRCGAIFDGSVELIGADWAPERPKAGDRVEVTFYYRVLEEADEDYKVFVHAEGRGSRSNRLNADHWPAKGRFPTGAWRKGDVIRDAWSFRVPAHFTSKEVELWTGFYQPGRDDRWPLTNRSEVRHDGKNRVLAAVIPLQ